MDLGRAYPVHQLFTHRTHDRVVGWTCVRVCAVGWMDGDEWLGLGPRVMDMPHADTGEGQDDVGTNDPETGPGPTWGWPTGPVHPRKTTNAVRLLGGNLRVLPKTFAKLRITWMS